MRAVQREWAVVRLPVLVVELADFVGLQHELLLQFVGGQRVLQQLNLQPRRLVEDLRQDNETSQPFLFPRASCTRMREPENGSQKLLGGESNKALTIATIKPVF